MRVIENFEDLHAIFEEDRERYSIIAKYRKFLEEYWDSKKDMILENAAVFYENMMREPSTTRHADFFVAAKALEFGLYEATLRDRETDVVTLLDKIIYPDK